MERTTSTIASTTRRNHISVLISNNYAVYFWRFSIQDENPKRFFSVSLHIRLAVLQRRYKENYTTSYEELGEVSIKDIHSIAVRLIFPTVPSQYSQSSESLTGKILPTSYGHCPAAWALKTRSRVLLTAPFGKHTHPTKRFRKKYPNYWAFESTLSVSYYCSKQMTEISRSITDVFQEI